jgi:hypothetical protein
LRRIALEEHYLIPELQELLGPQLHLPPPLEARLMDLGEGRIAEMNRQGIDMQVLSTLQPGLETSEPTRAVPVARAVNDRVAEAIAAHPDRLAALAALPTADPKAAAEELARTDAELGFKGALIHGRSLDRFLDDEDFWPIFEAAEALALPIYLHPRPPSRAIYDAYYSGFGDQIGFMLAGPAWGWHIETGLHAIRLILAGVFERFPALQVILGHMGEALPFMVSRLGEILGEAVEEYFRRNFHLTISGFFTDPPLLCALEVVGPERVLFAVDHPFSDGAVASQFLDRAPISEEDRAKIAYRNAELLLRL